jgi:hypothetical protein
MVSYFPDRSLLLRISRVVAAAIDPLLWCFDLRDVRSSFSLWMLLEITKRVSSIIFTSRFQKLRMVAE